MALEEDRVELEVDGRSVLVAETYRIIASVFKQPASFSLRTGHAGTTRHLVEYFRPERPFRLYIAGRQMQWGWTDGFTTEGESSTITVSGRDGMKRIFDAHLKADRSFKEASFFQLTETALTETLTPDELFTLSASNDANRRAVTGHRTLKARPRDIIAELDGVPTSAAAKTPVRIVYKTLKAKAGQRWLEFLRQQYRRAGLFLWAAGETGSYVLSRPNGNQDPAYRIVRSRSGGLKETNIVEHNWQNLTGQRWSKCEVYGRAGARKSGRGQIRGEYIDQEMAELVGGADIKPLVIIDEDAKTREQAQYMARRAIADANRDSWQLTYRVAGHTTRGTGVGRVTWAPDTVVSVDDEELGISGLYYISEVTWERNPHTTTLLTLTRPQDLIFAQEASLL